MAWERLYLPPARESWQGRTDLPEASCYFQIVHMLNLLEPLPSLTDKKAFALLGFRCDEGVRRNQGRTGAAEGPLSIRTQLAKLSIQRSDIVIYDAGDIFCEDGQLESAQQSLAHAVALLLQNKIVPILIGGGHEIAWGHYLGIIDYFKNEQLGIINFDAHFDMRPLLKGGKATSGTPFLQIAMHQIEKQRDFSYLCMGIQHAANIPLLFDTAKKNKVEFVTAGEIYTGDCMRMSQMLDRTIRENDILYTTICLDVFAAPYAPGVSAPQPLGLTPWQVLPHIRKLARSKKVVSYDLAELSPQYDKDHRTAKLAANLIAEIVHYHS